MTQALDATVTSSDPYASKPAILFDVLCLLVIAYAWFTHETAATDNPVSDLKVIVDPVDDFGAAPLSSGASPAPTSQDELLSIALTPVPTARRGIGRISKSLERKRKSVSFSITTTIEDLVHSPRRQCTVRPPTPFFPSASAGTPRARTSNLLMLQPNELDEWEEVRPPTPVPAIERHSTQVVDPMKVKKEGLMG